MGRMVDYSYNNYLTFGYGGGVMNDKSIGDTVSYNFTPCTRKPGTFREECKRTAELIYSQAQAAGRDVVVLVSGGMDSVAMVKGFVESGVPFKTATYEFIGGKNEHELEHVRAIVEEHNLDHVYFEMDGVKWLKSSEAHEWFHRTNTTNLATMPLMKLMEFVWNDMGGMPVFGGGDMDVNKYDGKWYYGRYESFITRYWFSERFGGTDFISFFQHTPELVLSILNEPEIQRVGQGKDKLANAMLNELKIVKYRAMHRIWPGQKRRPKYGGVELIHGDIYSTEVAWQKEAPMGYNEFWKMPFNEFVEFIQPKS